MTQKSLNQLECRILQTISYIQSFQVGVVRYAQSDSKQRVSYVSKMNSGTKLVFCMWLDIPKNVYLIQSICMYDALRDLVPFIQS